MPGPGDGSVIVIVPVVCAQLVGFVTVTVGDCGASGCGSITTLAEAVETHPAAFVTM
jgi:hypothetical protein